MGPIDPLGRTAVAWQVVAVVSGVVVAVGVAVGVRKDLGGVSPPTEDSVNLFPRHGRRGTTHPLNIS